MATSETSDMKGESLLAVTPKKKKPSFYTDVQQNKLAFGMLTLNKVHVLRRIHLFNDLDSPVLIDLKSTLGDRIRFQLENENLQDGCNQSEGPFANEIFNKVGYVQKIQLLPKAVNIPLVIAFQPVLENSDSAFPLIGKNDIEPREEYHKSFDVNGKIFLNLVGNDSERKRSVDERKDFQIENQTESISLRVKSSVCRSVLRVESQDQEVVFDNCVIHQTYVKDITVWNCSEIPLTYVINIEGSTGVSMFTFSEYDTGLGIDPMTPLHVDSFSHCRIRISCKPLKIGQFKTIFQIENSKDENNFETITVHTTVISNVGNLALMVSTNIVDFGSCYTGIITERSVTLRNSTDAPMDIICPHEKLPNGISIHSFSQSEIDIPRDVSSENVNKLEIEAQRREERNSIEQISLPVNKTRTIALRYIAEIDELDPQQKSYRLDRRNFRLHLDCVNSSGEMLEKRTIQCTANVCQSVVSVSIESVNFGNVNVGSTNQQNFQITNHSALNAHLNIRCLSSSLTVVSSTTFTDQSAAGTSPSVANKNDIKESNALFLNISPFQSQSLHIVFLPKADHHDFRSQIRISNTKNNLNEIGIVVRSNVIDPIVTRKGRFFKTITSSPGSLNIDDCINFGNVVANNPVLKSFVVKNLTKESLFIDLSTANSEHLKLYTVGENSLPDSNDGTRKVRKEKLLDDMEKSWLKHAASPSRKDRIKSRSNSMSKSQLPKFDVAYLDLANFGKQKHSCPTDIPLKKDFFVGEEITADSSSGSSKTLSHQHSSSSVKSIAQDLIVETQNYIRSDQNEKKSAVMSLQTLVKAFEIDIGSHRFSDVEAEEVYIEERDTIQTQLKDCLNGGILNVVSRCRIAPKDEIQIYVCYTPNSDCAGRSGKLRKYESSISLTLIKWTDTFNVDHAPIVDEIRTLQILGKVCQSNMLVGQRNINFGSLSKSNHSATVKAMVITNESEVPLLYKIIKSGSLASGDLQIGSGKMGVIRPYDKSKVEFLFKPTLPGVFKETLTIVNILDPTNNQFVHLKSRVMQPSTFFIKSLFLDYGKVFLNSTTGYSQPIVLTNDTNSPREFAIRADIALTTCAAVYPIFEFEVDEAQQSLPQSSLDRIEILEQKLKIATRKGQESKVVKITEELAKLRSGGAADDNNENTTSNSKLQSVKKLDDGIVILVGPKSTRQVDASMKLYNTYEVYETLLQRQRDLQETESWKWKQLVKAISSHSDLSDKFQDKKIIENQFPMPLLGDNGSFSTEKYEVFIGGITVHEERNVDMIKIITYNVCACQDETVIPPTETMYSLKTACTEAVIAANSSHLKTSGKLGYSKNTVFPPLNASENNHKKLGQDLLAGEGKVDIPCAISTAAHPSSPSFILEPTEFKFGDVFIGKTTSCDFFIENSSQEFPVQFKFNYSSLNEKKKQKLVNNSSLSCGRPPESENVCSVSKATTRVDDVTSKFQTTDCWNTNANNFKLKFSPGDGTIVPPGEKVKIHFELNELPVGYHKIAIDVKKMGKFDQTDLEEKEEAKKTISLRINIVHPKVFVFPELILKTKQKQEIKGNEEGRELISDGINDKSQEADLLYENCYIRSDELFCQIAPVTIQSIWEKEVFVICTSNLAKQVWMFSDKDCTKLLDNVSLAPKQSILVYVCFQPHAPEEILSTGERREIRGSVRFKAYDHPNLELEIQHIQLYNHHFGKNMALPTLVDTEDPRPCLLYQESLKFHIVYGQSVLSVDKRFISLGSSRVPGETYCDSFIISNVSAFLPLEFQLIPPKNLILSKDHGRLSCLKESQSLSSMKIDFKCSCSTFGLYNEKIEIINCNNPSQNFHITVRLFVDDNCIGTDLPPGENIIHLLDFRRFYLTPSINLDGLEENQEIKFMVDSQVWPKERSCDSNSLWNSNLIPHTLMINGVSIEMNFASFTVKNNLDKSISLLPMSDLNLLVFWKTLSNVVEDFNLRDSDLSSDQGNFGSNNAQTLRYNVCGSNYNLSPHECVEMFVSLPVPFPKSPLNSILARKLFRRGYGQLLLQRSLSSLELYCAKVVDLQCQYGVSCMEVTPKTIDFGKVGHIKSWDKEQREIVVSNKSEIPLVFRFQPSKFSLFKSGGFGLELINDKNICLSANESKSFVLELNPKTLDFENGNVQTEEIQLLNLNNNNDTKHVIITAQVTLFDLKFRRLGENNTLVLPALCYPSSNSEHPCEEWMSFEKKYAGTSVDADVSSKSCQYSIEVSIESLLQSFIALELYPRFSESQIPQELTLSLSEVYEVRIRMFVKPETRLSQPVLAYLVQDQPVLIGHLCIRSVEDNNMVPAEKIAIHGTLCEKPTFSISCNHIQLSTIAENDSDDSDSETECLEISREMDLPTQNRQDSEKFNIVNLFNDVPLSYRITAHFVSEEQNVDSKDVSMLFVSPEVGTILPAQSELILVALRQAKVKTSCTMYLDIEDIFARAGVSKQTLTVKILSDSKTVLKTGQPRMSEDDFSAVQDVVEEHLQRVKNAERCFLSLRCRGTRLNPSHLHYDINFGQHTHRTGNIQWEMTLSNNTPLKSIRYNIYSILEEDRQWLTFSRSKGTLKKRESHRIILNLSTFHYGSFVTYVVIENANNANDVTTLKVSIEVVLPLIENETEILNKKNANEIEDSLSTGASKVDGGLPEVGLTNKLFESPLGFLEPPNVSQRSRKSPKNCLWDLQVSGGQNLISKLSSSTADNANSTSSVQPSQNKTLKSPKISNINASSSSSSTSGQNSNSAFINMRNVICDRIIKDRSIVITNNLDVAAEFLLSWNLPTSDPSEIHISLSRVSNHICKSVIIPALSSLTVYILFMPRLNESELGSFERGISKEFELAVSCRLVCDVQKYARIKAIIWKPTLNVSTKLISWRGEPKNDDNGNACTILPVSSILKLKPLKPCVRYLIRSFMSCFTLQTRRSGISSESPHESTGEFDEIDIIVVPNWEEINRNYSSLKKGHYFEEFFIVYDRDRLFSKNVIRVCLSFGLLDYSSLFISSKSLLGFAKLEIAITFFVRNFRQCLHKDQNLIQDDVSQDGNDGTLPSTPEGFSNVDDMYEGYLLLINDLIFAGLFMSGSVMPFNLAYYFFSMILGNPFFKSVSSIQNDPLVNKWTQGLTYFITSFPMSLEEEKQFKKLANQLSLKDFDDT